MGSAVLGVWLFVSVWVGIPMAARYKLGREAADAIYKPRWWLTALLVAFAVLTTIGALETAERAARSGLVGI